MKKYFLSLLFLLLSSSSFANEPKFPYDEIPWAGWVYPEEEGIPIWNSSFFEKGGIPIVSSSAYHQQLSDWVTKLSDDVVYLECAYDQSVAETAVGLGWGSALEVPVFGYANEFVAKEWYILDSENEIIALVDGVSYWRSEWLMGSDGMVAESSDDKDRYHFENLEYYSRVSYVSDMLYRESENWIESRGENFVFNVNRNDLTFSVSAVNRKYGQKGLYEEKGNHGVCEVVTKDSMFENLAYWHIKQQGYLASNAKKDEAKKDKRKL